jgi:hypothetical protein
MNFSLLSEEKKVTWLKFFSDTVLHVNRNCRALQGQVDEYNRTAHRNVEEKEKTDFVESAYPSIKNAMFGISSDSSSLVYLR